MSKKAVTNQFWHVESGRDLFKMKLSFGLPLIPRISQKQIKETIGKYR